MRDCSGMGTPQWPPYSQARTAIASLRVNGSSGVGCRSNCSITKRVHQLYILESARQLRCGVPQHFQHHQVRTSAPRARASAPVWGAAAGPSSPSTDTAPRAHTWGAVATPSLPGAHSSTSSRVHGSSGVGFRSSSSITKRIHQLPEHMC